MKLLYPTNPTNKSSTPFTYLFHSALASGLLAVAACFSVAPKSHNHSSNYIDGRYQATDEGKKDTGSDYNWFY
jgi:hypothetical protein